jgi:methylaspartate ammonia-lyase
MNKNLYDISKMFIDFYDSIEDRLDIACKKAKEENNADIMQRLTDLADSSRFIMSDILDFNNTLDDIENFLKPKE